jgi:uncharacterized delta-60 repeat protein
MIARVHRSKEDHAKFKHSSRIVTTLLVVCAAPAVCLAGAGDLDPTFGDGGKVITDFGFNFDTAHALAIQADGRIVVAGRTLGFNTLGDDFALARYNPNGTLDATFGSGGLVTTDFASSFVDVARAVAIQAAGRIVVAGQTLSGSPRGFNFALARYEGVASPQELLELVVLDVQDLVPSFLNNGQGKSLLGKLKGAAQKLDAGHTDPAIRKLEAFRREVEALLNGAVLRPEEAEPLLVEVEILLLLLSP